MGKKVYEGTVIASVLGHSVSKDYDKAKLEWGFTGKVNDYGELKYQQPKMKCQLCGHPIRYGFSLKNSINGKMVEVGSECIDNYINITPRVENALEKAKKDAIQNKKRELKQKMDNAYYQALREAEKVKKAVYTSKINKDINEIDSLGNNRWVLHNVVQTGILYKLAKKHNIEINKDKINSFMILHTDKAGKCIW